MLEMRAKRAWFAHGTAAAYMWDMRLSSLLAAASLLFGTALGCAPDGDSFVPSGDGGSGGGIGAACTPGKQTRCACPGGAEDGIQVCNDEGTGFGVCECPSGNGGGPGAGGGGGSADACGDAECGDGEDCHTCEADCGTCGPCTLGPSCDAAQIPPATLQHAPMFDMTLQQMSKEMILARLESRIARSEVGARVVVAALGDERVGESVLVTRLRGALAASPKLRASIARGLSRAGADRLAGLGVPELEEPPMFVKDISYPGGTPECGSPLLRVRVAKIDVHEEDDDFANDIVYCALSSETMMGAEIRVTPQTPNLDEGDSFTYPIEAGVFWGQVEPKAPGSNMLLTYDCFETDSSDGFSKLLGSIGEAADALGAYAGSYGWVFDVVANVVPIVQDALALDGDDHLFNAQQTIGLESQMDLTNGRFWSVRRSGTHLNSDWDWELRVEAWGCAQYGGGMVTP